MWRSAVTWLRGRGHEVRVLTTDYRTPEPDSSMGEDPDVHRELRWYWRDHAFPRLGPGSTARLERHNAQVLDRHLAELRPDAVAWWAMGGMSLSLIDRARRTGLPAAGVVVDDWLVYGPRVDLRRRFTRRPRRQSIEASARWLFASRTLVTHARDAGWRLPGAEIAYPGIDHALFRDPPSRPDGWRWRLLYCGRIDERKGVDLAIESLTRLPEQATLRVVGGGDDEHLGSLRALAHRLNLADRVRFERRPRAELPAVYADADATLFPVRWEEPFGLVPLESMAMGTPVAASGRGGSGEYLRDGENCVLFDVEGGAEALAEAVGRLAGSAETRERIRRGGCQAASRFTDGRFNQAVEELLRRAERPGRPPSPSFNFRGRR